MLEGLSQAAVPALLLLVPLLGVLGGKPVYELFVAGATEGLRLTMRIFPYLLAMLVAVAVFRASGAFQLLAEVIGPLFSALGVPLEVLPLALLRPLSGSGALALTADIIDRAGPDSFTGILASVMQGSTDTTFYVIAVYFGSVGITDHRYALSVGLLADAVSFIASFVVCSLLFGGFS